MVQLAQAQPVAKKVCQQFLGGRVDDTGLPGQKLLVEVTDQLDGQLVEGIAPPEGALPSFDAGVKEIRKRAEVGRKQCLPLIRTQLEYFAVEAVFLGEMVEEVIDLLLVVAAPRIVELLLVDVARFQVHRLSMSEGYRDGPVI